VGHEPRNNVFAGLNYDLDVHCSEITTTSYSLEALSIVLCYLKGFIRSVHQSPDPVLRAILTSSLQRELSQNL
jgi:hypothetical protein